MVAAVVVSSIIFGPIGGIVGFFLGIFIKGATANKVEDHHQPSQHHTNEQVYKQQSDQQNRQTHQHQTSESDITIQSLVPIIGLVSYFCLKKDNQWTSEKVRFVKPSLRGVDWLYVLALHGLDLDSSTGFVAIPVSPGSLFG